MTDSAAHWNELHANPRFRPLYPSEDVVRFLREGASEEVQRIGERAQQRVLAEHTSEKRAEQFEASVENIGDRETPGSSEVATSDFLTA